MYFSVLVGAFGYLLFTKSSGLTYIIHSNEQFANKTFSVVKIFIMSVFFE